MLFPLLETVDLPVQPCLEPVVTLSSTDGTHGVVSQCSKTLNLNVENDVCERVTASGSSVSDNALTPISTTSDEVDSPEGGQQLQWKPPACMPHD